MTTAVPKLEDIRLNETAFWTRPLDERAAAMDVLRAQPKQARFDQPVVPGRPPVEGEKEYYFALTSHADVIAASKNPDDFCSGQGATSPFDQDENFNDYFGSMINMDDPRHKRLRGLVSAGFTPRQLQRAEDAVERIATKIVDRVLEIDGEFDFVEQVAAALPLEIICDMMGVPESQYEFVFNQSNLILGAGDPEYVSDPSNIVDAILNAGFSLGAMMGEIADDRRQNPTDDLTTALVQAEIDGDRLSTQELSSFFILLLVAGNETTRNAISWAMHLLTEHPEQKQLLIDDFDTHAASAVEEIVRWAAPVIFMRRTATRDGVMLGDQVFEAGDKVLLYYWAANRDPQVFENPHAFDITRTPGDHLGFGAPGPHFCMGAHLARREITVMLRELLRRVPSIHATGAPDRLQSSFINGVKHLPASL